MTKVLFLLKAREDYSQDPSYSHYGQIATGMWNSAMFVAEVLNENFMPSTVDMIVDANAIDGSVMLHQANLIFIEGLWVTPAKFVELKSLPRHFGRTFVVRIHSEIPFLATEGVAMDWIAEYLAAGVSLAPNSPRAHDELCNYARALGYSEDFIAQFVLFLPNCYPTDFRTVASSDLVTTNKPVLDIACFGAFRPMKNHLFSALLAVKFAQTQHKKLRFHINDRVDMAGQGPANNIEGLFAQLNLATPGQYTLVHHGWENRETFLQSINDVDLLMQISLSETFNIVAADAVLVGRPVLGSDEISWLYPMYADPNDQKASLKTLNTLWANKSFFLTQNRTRLKSFAKKSASIWVRYVSSAR